MEKLEVLPATEAPEHRDHQPTDLPYGASIRKNVNEATGIEYGTDNPIKTSATTAPDLPSTRQSARQRQSWSHPCHVSLCRQASVNTANISDLGLPQRSSTEEASSSNTSALETVIMVEAFDLQVEFDQYSYNFREKTSNNVIKDFNSDIAIHQKKSDNGKEAGVHP
ncbi:hypothetical protein PG996_008158 [Apiospora saccharicola]|uniref:Uncharacterized protein n=1 Tax=Apiospora saccharicola TaxID=335842 RepID=A0ABR1UX31_9PEZI